MKKLTLTILLILVLAVSSCSEQEFACNSPNSLVGNSCCLDENSNKICDSNEVEETSEKKTEQTITSVEVKEEAPPTNQLDLEDYPDMFIKDNSLDGSLVIGNDASAATIVGVSDIAVSLQFSKSVQTGERVVIRKIEVESTVLAKEITDIEAQNLISVGNACENSITDHFLGNPSDCREGTEDGKGYLALYPNGDKIALLVYGYDELGTRLTSGFLADFDEHQLSGSSMEIDLLEQGKEALKDFKGSIEDSIGILETETYTINGVDYIINVKNIENSEVDFEVNGKSFGMDEGDADEEIDDYMIIRLVGLENDEMEFILYGAAALS
jgi:hypothetical protein